MLVASELATAAAVELLLLETVADDRVAAAEAVAVEVEVVFKVEGITWRARRAAIRRDARRCGCCCSCSLACCCCCCFALAVADDPPAMMEVELLNNVGFTLLLLLFACVAPVVVVAVLDDNIPLADVTVPALVVVIPACRFTAATPPPPPSAKGIFELCVFPPPIAVPCLPVTTRPDTALLPIA